MRSPQYQLDIMEELIERWIKKVEHSIRALRDDKKKDNEWTYLHLTGLQDDIMYLSKYIDQYQVVQIMRDADEI